MKTFLTLAATALILCSCDYTSGTNVTADQAKQFTVGKSTIADVEGKLGQPTKTTTNSDGTQTVEYQYNTTHQDGMNYVPVVGMFSQKVEQSYNTTDFVFSRSGLLQSFTSGAGNNTMHN
jgi:hypothetical protein